MSNVIFLTISVIIGLVLFARQDAEGRRAICWIFIFATAVAIFWFFAYPQLWLTSQH
jgi:hypothetical protein